MMLLLLLERTYEPYRKWFGQAFRRVERAAELLPLISMALAADTWRQRQEARAHVYQRLSLISVQLAIGPSVDATIRTFHARPLHTCELHTCRISPNLVQDHEI